MNVTNCIVGVSCGVRSDILAWSAKSVGIQKTTDENRQGCAFLCIVKWPIVTPLPLLKRICNNETSMVLKFEFLLQQVFSYKKKKTKKMRQLMTVVPTLWVWPSKTFLKERVT